MPRKIDMRKVELARARHDEADDAYDDWESEQFEKLNAHDYDETFPVASRMNTTPYVRQFRRSQPVSEASRLRTSTDE